MAKFEFRLEPVLRQRELVEEDRQRDLAKVLRQRMILQTQLQNMQRSITESKHGLADGLVGKVDLDQVSHFARYSGQQSQRAHQILVRMTDLERQIQEARGLLLNATRDRKRLELLRQRRFDRWRSDQQRREAIEMDELSMQQYIRHANAEVAG